MEDFVVAGRIGRAHGLKGEVFVEPRTFAEHREIGYLAALSARGVPFDPALMGNSVFTDEVAFGHVSSTNA